MTLAAMQQRRDTAVNWTVNNPVPLQGEICLELDTGKEKIGDGVSTWTALPYRFTSPVQTVFGRTGNIVGAPTDIVGFNTAAAAAAPVQSVFSRIGAVVAVSGDYNADQITETSTNKVLTAAERIKLAGIEPLANVNPVNLDGTPDSATRLAMTPAERTKLTGTPVAIPLSSSALAALFASNSQLANVVYIQMAAQNFLVQRGQTVVPASASIDGGTQTSVTLPISVDLQKSFVMLGVSRPFHAGRNTPANTSITSAACLSCLVELVTSNTLFFGRDSNNIALLADDVIVPWEVVTYVGPAGGKYEFSVLGRGIDIIAATDSTKRITLPLTGTNLQKMVPNITGMSSTANGSKSALPLIASTSILELERNSVSAGLGHTIAWEVIEFTGDGWEVAVADTGAVDSSAWTTSGSLIYMNVPLKDYPLQRAMGTVAFSLAPEANATLTLNGTVWTFVTASPTGNQILIGIDGIQTGINAAAALKVSTETQTQKCSYQAQFGVLTIQYDTPGIVGNTFTLAASVSPNLNATLSGATLSNGLAADPLPKPITSWGHSFIKSYWRQPDDAVTIPPDGWPAAKPGTFLLGVELDQLNLRLTTAAATISPPLYRRSISYVVGGPDVIVNRPPDIASSASGNNAVALPASTFVQTAEMSIIPSDISAVVGQTWMNGIAGAWIVSTTSAILRSERSGNTIGCQVIGWPRW